MEESEKLEDTCRLCDEISGQMFYIFDKNDEGNQIVQLIKECLPIIVSSFEHFSSFLFSVCILTC